MFNRAFIFISATLIIFTILNIYFNFFKVENKKINSNYPSYITSNSIQKTGNILIEDTLLNEDLIIVNLQDMKIDMVKEGQVSKVFNIVSKGKPGSYYETPTGEYKVKGKYGNKFSSLGKVYMPYAIQFYGNFFIHGIPYYADGTKVSSSYSGGCIRMHDADAKEIYDFVKTNTRIIVLTNEVLSDKNDPGIEMANNMLTVLTSLETVNQEKYVTFQEKEMQIKNLNKYILENNKEAENIILNQVGKYNFNENKLEKMKAIGLHDTRLTDEKERIILLNYITTNKSYILKLLN